MIKIRLALITLLSGCAVFLYTLAAFQFFCELFWPSFFCFMGASIISTAWVLQVVALFLGESK